VTLSGAIEVQPSAVHIYQAARRRMTFEVGPLAGGLAANTNCSSQGC